MARQRRTRTQQNIDTINKYIARVADTFGLGSGQYMEAKNLLRGYETRESKRGILQIRDIDVNRKKSQALAALKKKTKQNRVAKMLKRDRKAYSDQTGIPEDDIFEEDFKEFQRMQNDYNNLIDACYKLWEDLEDVGIYLSGAEKHQTTLDMSYYQELRAMVERLRREQGIIKPNEYRGDDGMWYDNYSHTGEYEAADGFENKSFFDFGD
ncbi:MAG: hypothetical protein MJZ37_08500 [Bacilli bacterium]|nr:hypothetical protein [Bacilli bacterium]